METDATWQAKAESSTGEAAGSLVTRSRKSVTYSGSMLESTAQPSDSHLSVLSKAKVTAMGAFVNVFQQQERDRVMVKMTQSAGYGFTSDVVEHHKRFLLESHEAEMKRREDAGKRMLASDAWDARFLNVLTEFDQLHAAATVIQRWWRSCCAFRAALAAEARARKAELAAEAMRRKFARRGSDEGNDADGSLGLHSFGWGDRNVGWGEQWTRFNNNRAGGMHDGADGEWADGMTPRSRGRLGTPGGPGLGSMKEHGGGADGMALYGADAADLLEAERRRRAAAAAAEQAEREAALLRGSLLLQQHHQYGEGLSPRSRGRQAGEEDEDSRAAREAAAAAAAAYAAALAAAAAAREAAGRAAAEQRRLWMSYYYYGTGADVAARQRGFRCRAALAGSSTYDLSRDVVTSLHLAAPVSMPVAEPLILPAAVPVQLLPQLAPSALQPAPTASQPAPTTTALHSHTLSGSADEDANDVSVASASGHTVGADMGLGGMGVHGMSMAVGSTHSSSGALRRGAAFKLAGRASSSKASSLLPALVQGTRIGQLQQHSPARRPAAAMPSSPTAVARDVSVPSGSWPLSGVPSQYSLEGQVSSRSLGGCGLPVHHLRPFEQRPETCSSSSGGLFAAEDSRSTMMYSSSMHGGMSGAISPRQGTIANSVSSSLLHQHAPRWPSPAAGSSRCASPASAMSPQASTRSMHSIQGTYSTLHGGGGSGTLTPSRSLHARAALSAPPGGHDMAHGSVQAPMLQGISTSGIELHADMSMGSSESMVMGRQVPQLMVGAVAVPPPRPTLEAWVATHGSALAADEHATFLYQLARCNSPVLNARAGSGSGMCSPSRMSKGEGRRSSYNAFIAGPAAGGGGQEELLNATGGVTHGLCSASTPGPGTGRSMSPGRERSRAAAGVAPASPAAGAAAGLEVSPRGHGSSSTPGSPLAAAPGGSTLQRRRAGLTGLASASGGGISRSLHGFGGALVAGEELMVDMLSPYLPKTPSSQQQQLAGAAAGALGLGPAAGLSALQGGAAVPRVLLQQQGRSRPGKNSGPGRVLPAAWASNSSSRAAGPASVGIDAGDGGGGAGSWSAWRAGPAPCPEDLASAKASYTMQPWDPQADASLPAPQQPWPAMTSPSASTTGMAGPAHAHAAAAGPRTAHPHTHMPAAGPGPAAAALQPRPPAGQGQAAGPALLGPVSELRTMRVANVLLGGGMGLGSGVSMTHGSYAESDDSEPPSPQGSRSGSVMAHAAMVQTRGSSRPALHLTLPGAACGDACSPQGMTLSTEAAAAGIPLLAMPAGAAAAQPPSGTVCSPLGAAAAAASAAASGSSGGAAHPPASNINNGNLSAWPAAQATTTPTSRAAAGGRAGTRQASSVGITGCAMAARAAASPVHSSSGMWGPWSAGAAGSDAAMLDASMHTASVAADAAGSGAAMHMAAAPLPAFRPRSVLTPQGIRSHSPLMQQQHVAGSGGGQSR